jgi:hypothetical protein
MTAGGPAWWAGKIRQTVRYVAGRVGAAERAALADWVLPDEIGVFDVMHRADRRHGLDVVATLRADGVTDREVLVAGLLHDAGKGDAGLVPRVVHALAVAYGPGIARAAARLPGLAEPLARMRDHAERSAALARSAGCSDRTVELIRWQDAPRDPVDGERLRLADEAN